MSTPIEISNLFTRIQNIDGWRELAIEAERFELWMVNSRQFLEDDDGDESGSWGLADVRSSAFKILGCIQSSLHDILVLEHEPDVNPIIPSEMSELDLEFLASGESLEALLIHSIRDSIDRLYQLSAWIPIPDLFASNNPPIKHDQQSKGATIASSKTTHEPDRDSQRRTTSAKGKEAAIDPYPATNEPAENRFWGMNATGKDTTTGHYSSTVGSAKDSVWDMFNTTGKDATMDPYKPTYEPAKDSSWGMFSAMGRGGMVDSHQGAELPTSSNIGGVKATRTVETSSYGLVDVCSTVAPGNPLREQSDPGSMLGRVMWKCCQCGETFLHFDVSPSCYSCSHFRCHSCQIFNR